MKRILLIVCGTLFVALGAIGIVVPILPTTPFLLLAAFCYARSSQRFLQWLLTNRWFGRYIKNYREGRGLPLREKVLTIAALWLAILFSVLHVVSALWLRLLLIVTAVGVTVHLVCIKTFKSEAQAKTSEHVRPPNGPGSDPSAERCENTEG